MRMYLLVLLVVPLGLAQIVDTRPANLSIEGMITDEITGAPISGVRVVLMGNGPDRAVAFTDVAGYFRIVGLQAGPHNLTAIRSGYLRTSRSLALSPGLNLADVQIAMPPQAVISGRVEDQDGWPAADATVIVLMRDATDAPASAQHSGSVSTNDRGQFRMAGLSPGRYYLRVGTGSAQSWDDRYTDVFYPSALTFQNAEAIELKAGQQRAGIVVSLQKSAGVRIQGSVALPPGFVIRQNGLGAQVSLSTADIPGSVRTTYAPLAEDGSFTLTNVRPGKYRLQPELPPPYSRGFNTGGVVEPNLEVGSADISGIVLNVEDTMPIDLAGSVIFDSGSRPAPVIIHLMQGNAVQAQTASLDDGSFVLRGVPPGKYRLSAHSAGSGMTSISARLGGADLPYGNLELKGPNPGFLEITVSSGIARVEGVALAAAKYVLFRASNPGLEPIALATIDSSDHFTTYLRPGEYHVWLATEMPANLWDDKDAPQGQVVTVVQGENPPLRIVLPAVK